MSINLYTQKISLLIIFCLVTFSSVQAQSVTNGSVTGAPAANSGINNGNAPGWSGCGFSPDLCSVSFPSYSGSSSVAPIASPDGGTWLGMASLVECAQSSITGLTVGQSYTLYFCGANFGSGTTIFFGGPARPEITLGATTQQFSIPQAASTWGGYSMTFTANAATMTLRCVAPNSSGSFSNAGSYFVGLDGFSLSPTAASCTVLLGVEWEKIAAQPKDNKAVEVVWGMAREEDFDNYEIQRSVDGVHFNTIAEQKAIGNSSEATEYLFLDKFLPAETIMDGGTLYYRIKQISINGTFSYSAIAVVTIRPSEDQTMVIYPNPVQDLLTLDVLSLEATEGAQINIYAVSGQVVYQQQLTVMPGRNIKTLDLSKLAAGTYFLKMTTDSGKSYQRKFTVEGE